MQQRRHTENSARLLKTQGVGGDAIGQRADARLVWGSIMLVFLLSLLPWRLMDAAPDLLMLVLAFWSVHESRRVGMLTGFVLGLLIDVHDGGPLGQYALTYVLACYGAVILHRRLLRFDLWSQALHMLLVFLVARSVTILIAAWLTGTWPGWWWGVGVLVASALWVPVGWLLLLPSHRLDDVNSEVG